LDYFFAHRWLGFLWLERLPLPGQHYHCVAVCLADGRS